MTDCDQILILDHGRIIEQGTHDELLAKADGHYAALWTSQRTQRKLQVPKNE